MKKYPQAVDKPSNAWRWINMIWYSARSKAIRGDTLPTETVLVVSDALNHEMSSYLYRLPIDLRDQIQIIQAVNYPEAIRLFQEHLANCLALIVRSYRLGPYPVSFMLIPIAKETYQGPIIVIGQREASFGWIVNAMKAGASHHVERQDMVPALLQKLLAQKTERLSSPK